MGNVVTNVQQIISGDKEPITPPLKSLTERQIEIIKRTWAIPYSKVNEQFITKYLKFKKIIYYVLFIISQEILGK